MRILDESMGIWRLWDVFWGCLYLWESLKKIKSHPEEVGKKKGEEEGEGKGKKGAATESPQKSVRGWKRGTKIPNPKSLDGGRDSMGKGRGGRESQNSGRSRPSCWE